MKSIIYKDSDGYLRRTCIRDGDPDSMAECGVPAGPPDVRDLDVDWLLREINNLLVKLELFDWDDVQRTSGGLTPAVNLFKRTLIGLYRQEAINQRKLGEKNG